MRFHRRERFAFLQQACKSPDVEAVCYGLIPMQTNEGLHEYKLRMGYRVATAFEGETAIRVFEQHAANGEPFDAVILDMRQEHEDLRGVCRCVSGHVKDRPVVAVTS